MEPIDTTESQLRAVKTQELVMKLVWVGLFLSHLMFLFISHFIARSREEGAEAAISALRPEIFFGLAAMSLVLSKVLPKLIAKGLVRGQDPNAETDPSLVDSRTAGALFAPFVIELALIESVSIYGFLVGFVIGRLDFQKAFFFAAMLFMARAFPKSLIAVRERYLGR